MDNGLSAFFERIKDYRTDEKNRKYENIVMTHAKKISAEDIGVYLKYAEDESNPIFERKACFFVVFTYYRKRVMTVEMNAVMREFRGEVGFDFNNDPLLYHIRLLNVVYQSAETTKELLIEFEKKLNGQKDKFGDFIGFLNHYVEIVATYYETHLKERLDTSAEGAEKKKSADERLQKALEYITRCCDSDIDYPKFYVNKGRILVLLQDYENGEREMRNGIALIGANDERRDVMLSEFSGRIDRIISIISFDKSFATVMECEKKQEKLDEEIKKTRLENIKNLSLIGAALSFILVSIQAFTNITDYKVVGLVMLMYAGLVMVTMGTITLIAHFAMGRKQDRSFAPIAISIILFILGVGMFLAGMLLKV